MSRRRSRYTREFKEQAVELWRNSGGTIAECARELGIAEGSLGNWIKQFGESEDDTLTDADMAELERLREENMRLQKENLILKNWLFPGIRGSLPWELRAVAAEGEHGEGDEGLGSAEPEGASVYKSDLCVRGFDEAV